MIPRMELLRRLILAALVVVMAAPAALAQTSEGPNADVSLSMTKPATTPLVGDVFQLVFTVRNSGPDAAPDAVFSDYLSQELELQSIQSTDVNDTCGRDEPVAQAQPESGSGGGSAGSGSVSPARYGGGVNCTLGTLANGEETTITLTLKRVGARETYNSAWVGASVNDPDYDDNYTDLQLEADKSRPADVGVTMTAPKSPEVGADFSYTITVTNDGPSTADAVTLYDPIPYGATHRSVATSRAADVCRLTEYPGYEDGGGPAYGGYSELTCDLAPLPAGDAATITLNVNRSSAYEIWNSAWVWTSNYDANYENDYASHAIPADPSVTSDLAVTMRGPETTPLVGDDFSYVIEVTNKGPSQAGDVYLSDFLPEGVAFVSATPADKCSYNDSQPSGGKEAQSAAPPSAEGAAYYPIYANGVFCNLGALATGETATVTITVTRTHAREIWNSAWVSSSNYDPNYDNNYSDVQTGPDKSKPADIGLTMTAPGKPDVGSDFDFVLTVTNGGPSQADGVVVTDYVPYGVDFKSVTSSAPDACTYNSDEEPQPYETTRPSFYGYREVGCELGSLPAGGSATVTITVTRTTEYEIWNSGWATTSNYDESYENDYASVLVEGEPYPGVCPAEGTAEGTRESDQIVVGDCAVEAKAGADSVEVVPSSGPSSSNVATGRGADTITVNLAIGSTSRRTIEVHGGPGADTIVLTVAPGAGNATVVLDGGRGDDYFEVSAPAGVTGLRILILGRDGNDTLSWRRATSGSTSGVPGLRVRGGAGRDLLQGGDGPDRLRGGAGRDRLYGGLDDDHLVGGPGADICRGGPGRDTREAC